MILTDRETSIYKAISDVLDEAFEASQEDEQRLLYVARKLASQHKVLMLATNTEIIAAILVKVRHMETNRK